MEIVEVIWLDAGLESAHMEIEHAREIKPMERKNTGYLLRSDREVVIVCFGSISDKGMSVVDQTLIIPKKMVSEIRRLS